MKHIFLTLVLLTLNSCGDPEHTPAPPTIAGVSTFAIKKDSSPGTEYPCEVIKEALNGVRSVYIAVLDKTFGSSLKCLEDILQSDIVIEGHVYLDNGAGRRNLRLSQLEHLPELTVQEWDELWVKSDPRVVEPYLERVRWWKDFISLFPQVRYWALIEGLESGEDPTATRARVLTIKTVWQGKIGVNPLNYVPGIVTYTGADFVELHGDTPESTEACVANNDGTMLDWNDERTGRSPDEYADLGANLCGRILLWEGELSNGIGTWDPWIPPEFRTFELDMGVLRRVNSILKRYNGES